MVEAIGETSPLVTRRTSNGVLSCFGWREKDIIMFLRP